MEEWWALLTGAFQVAVMGIVETQESSMGILINVDQRSKTSFQKGKKNLCYLFVLLLHARLCGPPHSVHLLFPGNLQNRVWNNDEINLYVPKDS